MDILWIVTTQWRAQACGYSGDPNACTPALDALEKDSINFTQAVTPHPFGPFARAALLTGKTSPQNGVKDYFDPLPPGSTTIVDTLHALGYHCAFFGKWHLAPRDPLAPLVGEAHAKMIVPEAYRAGFDFWEGFESGFLLNAPWLHGSRLREPKQFPAYQSRLLCERALAYLIQRKAASDVPNFLMISLEAPHPPYAAPADGFLPLPPGKILLPPSVPRGGAIEEKARKELSGYYAHIRASDHAIGLLLKQMPDYENTLIVFTSVHGDMHGSHGCFRKGWPYEESIRVPLLVKLPQNQKAGKSSRLLSLLDLPAYTQLWAKGEDPLEGFPPPQQQLISMPSIVRLPLQCPRLWYGWRNKREKQVFNSDGTLWFSEKLS